MITQARRGQRVVTMQWRRFYAEMPQTQWVIRAPIMHVRTYPNGRQAFFNPGYFDLTADIAMSNFSHVTEEYRLASFMNTRDGPDQEQQLKDQMEAWGRLLRPGRKLTGTQGS